MQVIPTTVAAYAHTAPEEKKKSHVITVIVWGDARKKCEELTVIATVLGMWCCNRHQPQRRRQKARIYSSKVLLRP